MGQNKSEKEEPENEIPLKNLSALEKGGEGGTETEQEGVVLDNRRNSSDDKVKQCFLKVVVILLVIGVVALVAYFLLQQFKPARASGKKKEGLVPPNVEVPLPPSSSVLHVFQNGAVCSDSDVCSQVGRDIFHRGGNAVDAAVATLFCSGIATMQSLGIGGGFLMNIYIRRENKAYTVDAREVAPLAAKEDMFMNKSKTNSMQGPLAIGVPGEVMGYWEAHKRFGSMTWKEVIEPSIKICQDGIILTKHMWDALQTNRLVKNDQHLRSTFVNETTGEFYHVGTLVFPPKELCETYKLLMANGAVDFYNGTLATQIVEDLKEIGSIISAEDLEAYNVNWHYSIPVELNSNVLHVSPPVGSGTILAFILNILRAYHATNDTAFISPEDLSLRYHRFIEAFKFAFAKRFDLGDARFNNLSELIGNLTSPQYAEETRKKIDDSRTFDDPKHYGANFWSKSQLGTSHLSVLAPNGDAVSATSTVNFYFGCGFTGRRTGIIFNSGMDDFSTPGMENFFGLPGSEPNFIKPQKRAMSSMCPTIVTNKNGDVKLVVGAAGGSKIPTSVAWVIARVLWFGDNIKEAIDAPRIHHQLIPNELQYEYGVLQSVIDGLKARRHKMHRYLERGSTLCGIERRGKSIYANADYRKKGDVSGL